METVCQFCNKKIIPPKKGCRSSVNGVFLCDDCIRICFQTLERTREKENSARTMYKNFHMTPQDIKDELDKHIIGQDEAKISIAIAVYNHYKRMNIKTDIQLSKSNILLIGPTGSGKTLIAKTVANMLDIPFTIADCTSITETGYVGDDVESILTSLLNAAHGDIQRAEKGIVFLDEIDKIAKTNLGNNLTKDPSGEGVQQALLKLIEGTKAHVSTSGDKRNPNDKGVEINTENILFICGGAFQGLENIINKRTITTTTSIGFGANVEQKKEQTLNEAFSQVTVEDIVKYGLIPELVGRLPIIVSLNELGEKEMIDILTKPDDCIVNQYKEFFKYDGVELEFTTDSIKEIARETIKRNTGARGLRGILEEILKESMFTIPSDTDIEKCIVEKGCKVKVVKRQAKKMAY